MDKEVEVTKCQMWIYGLPAILRDPLIVFMAIYSIIFYEELGASLSIMAFFIGISRALDVLNDPLIANWSDNTKTKYGRRYPWILGSFIFFVIAVIGYWIPPEGEGIEAWFAIFNILVYIGYSLVYIPYAAIAPELTYDYNTRQEIYATQAFIECLGYLVMSFFPAILAELVQSERAGFAIMAILMCILFVIFVIVMVCKIKPNLDPIEKPGEFVPSLLKLRKNYPFMQLVAPWCLDMIAAVIQTVMMPFVVLYVIDPEGWCEDEGENTDDLACSGNFWIGMFIVVYIVGGAVGVPVWHFLAKKFGKRRVWIWWAAFFAITRVLCFIVLRGASGILLLIGFFSGFPWGGRFLTESMLIDIIEYEELVTSRRAEGTFTMFQAFLTKLIAIPAQVIPLGVLFAIGFEPTDDGDHQNQPDNVKIYLRMMFALVPLVCMIISWILRLYHPFRAGWQIDAIREEITKRKNGQAIIKDPITDHELLPAPKTANFEKDFEFAELFQESKTLNRIIQGEFKSVYNKQIGFLIMWIFLSICCLIIMIAGFELLYEPALSWIPILATVFLGITCLYVMFYSQRIHVMKKFSNHKFDKNFLKEMSEFYDNLDANYVKIKEGKHTKAVYEHGRTDSGNIELMTNAVDEDNSPQNKGEIDDINPKAEPLLEDK